MTLQVIPAFQRLTFDVLGYLFGIICLSDPSKGPILISHISHWWRLVALDSPLMWSDITIQLFTSLQKHPLASAYFERSQNVPISLTIHAIRRLQPWEKTELLLPHAHRFRSLHVKASAGFLANLLWLDLNMPMPRLEAFESIISNTSRISINRKTRIATVDSDETVNIIPSVSTRNLVCWHSWNPTGLTALTLDTTRLSNKPDLDDIYNALAITCHTIQHFEYVGLVACIDAGVNIRTRLVFPVLRSLAVLSHDDMVPLLRLMIIPALDSLVLRDFIACPHIPTLPASELMDIDELTPGLTFDPDGLFRVIKEWKSMTHLEIFGIDDLPSDDLSPPPDLLNFIKSLDQLSSLVLYGIGAPTSLAYILFIHDPSDSEEPLLPQLSHFLLATNNMPAAPNDDLCRYLVARQQHNLPRLQKLSVNWEYIQRLIELNRINILWESSDEVFVIADPEFGKHTPIEEVNLLQRLPRE
jgi:hypothetical protein